MDMRRMATVFVIAVLVPTLVLAWLAMRSLRDQELIANSQRAILHQSSTEALAADVNTFMDDVRVFFHQLVDELVEERGQEVLSTQFDTIAPELWSQCSAASVITDQGEILCPTPATADPRAQAFLKINTPFLLNQSDEKFYVAESISNQGPVVTKNRIETPALIPREEKSVDQVKREKEESSLTRSKQFREELDLMEAADEVESSSKKIVGKSASSVQLKVEVAEEKLRSNNPFRRLSEQQSRSLNTYSQQALPNAPPVPARQGGSTPYGVANDVQQAEPLLRKVSPSQNYLQQQSITELPVENLSTLQWGIGNLHDIIDGKDEGALSRFLQDGLQVMLWRRHPSAPGRIFWVQLDLPEIQKDLIRIVTGYSSTPEICLALLDAEGNPVSKTISEFDTDWSKPFVASEVGQIFPHWEVAAYLLDPEAVNRSVRTAKLTLWLLVPMLLGAIALGTLLIFRSIGMEMKLARQKTDFVSNVSHELRTPLTSIRMFSDMLNETAGSEKDREYSGIISREAARLTRLINNLLDFSRLERTDKPYTKESIDLASLTRETVETYRMQLEADGCRLVYEEEENINPQVRGDRDALSQVLLNLLSNAEKYGCPEGEIKVRLSLIERGTTARWEVLDRGKGIERKHASKIFDKFYRVDDSLSSEKQGSGLGLALANQIVTHHGGTISHRNRASGGSCFSVTLPVEIAETDSYE